MRFKLEFLFSSHTSNINARWYTQTEKKTLCFLSYVIIYAPPDECEYFVFKNTLKILNFYMYVNENFHAHKIWFNAAMGPKSGNSLKSIDAPPNIIHAHIFESRNNVYVYTQQQPPPPRRLMAFTHMNIICAVASSCLPRHNSQAKSSCPTFIYREELYRYAADFIVYMYFEHV